MRRRDERREAVCSRVAYWAQRLNVRPRRVRIQSMKRKWGSCSTSGTVTSARVLAARLPEGVIHQYAPVDQLLWVRRFLDHWRPDLVLWVESEFWPAALSEFGARGLPAALVNARLSARSWRRWRRARWIIRRLLRE